MKCPIVDVVLSVVDRVESVGRGLMGMVNLLGTEMQLLLYSRAQDIPRTRCSHLSTTPSQGKSDLALKNRLGEGGLFIGSLSTLYLPFCSQDLYDHGQHGPRTSTLMTMGVTRAVIDDDMMIPAGDPASA
jgi:hypothetical protein